MREIVAVYQNTGIIAVNSENIRLRLKTLIKTAKLIISTRKLQTDNQKQKESEFLRNIDSIFAVAARLPDSTEASTSTSNEHESMSQDYYDENEMMKKNSF